MELLTNKQELFCLEYIKSGNATNAALVAYDTTDVDTAKSIGCENLTKPYVIDRIKALREPAEKATIATLEERKEILSSILREKESKTMPRISAISELNKMDHVYDSNIFIDNRSIKFVIVEDESRPLPQLEAPATPQLTDNKELDTK